MNKNTLLIVGIFIVSGVLGFLLSLHLHARHEITMMETYHYPSQFVDQLKGDKEAGKKIFKEFCAACHSPNPQIDINAPHIGDASAWKLKRQLGIDTLLTITAHGVGAMPARGGCFECDDEQLKATIQYMLDQTN